MPLKTGAAFLQSTLTKVRSSLQNYTTVYDDDVTAKKDREKKERESDNSLPKKTEKWTIHRNREKKERRMQKYKRQK